MCKFCSADVWPGALDDFSVVSPPQPASAADTSGNGGMVPRPEHSEPDEPPREPRGSRDPAKETVLVVVEGLEAQEVMVLGSLEIHEVVVLENPEAREVLAVIQVEKVQKASQQQC
ncbi:hypothetical protein CYMTET_4234 [Cymbomonas tetramitiformis]|uniref:Uncharacterized protein n=1 Tax=Cymbomonas tetramitiformis TaxID=36881 RepID=A0AAE0H1U8_9CHLO|nr:hypothetical protein CYMTET_4234 [Cymbomonas tetramitiformis]